jgi:ketosteroid isomerase-like protein
VEPVVLVERAFSLYAAGDFDAMFDLVAEDAELDPVYEPGAPRGIVAVVDFFLSAGDPRKRWQVEDTHYREVGGEVLVTGRLVTIGAFGQSFDYPVSWLIAVAAGKIVRMRGFVGLPPELHAGGAPDS